MRKTHDPHDYDDETKISEAKLVRCLTCKVGFARLASHKKCSDWDVDPEREEADWEELPWP